MSGLKTIKPLPGERATFWRGSHEVFFPSTKMALFLSAIRRNALSIFK